MIHNSSSDDEPYDIEGLLHEDDGWRMVLKDRMSPNDLRCLRAMQRDYEM